METIGIIGLYSDYNAVYISGGEVQVLVPSPSDRNKENWARYYKAIGGWRRMEAA